MNYRELFDIPEIDFSKRLVHEPIVTTKRIVIDKPLDVLFPDPGKMPKGTTIPTGEALGDMLTSRRKPNGMRMVPAKYGLEACASCRTLFQKKTANGKYCPPCSKLATQKKTTLRMESIRKDILKCERCGAEFSRTGLHQKRCTSAKCARAHKTEWQKRKRNAA